MAENNSQHAPSSATQSAEAATVPPNTNAGASGPGRLFGRYVLLGLLGKGGMGAVYLARDSVLDRQVALKIPHPDVIASPQALERFYREARAAAQLDHPGICRIFDVGSHENQPYITMTCVEGEPLSRRIDQFVGQPRRAAELVSKIALALAEAHARGIIHRDLKPSNIMLDRRGEPVIMDFGLARIRETPEAGQTGHGVIVGTPSYMSPEQAAGDNTHIGPATDVYSLGIILYELLTGRVPFSGSFISLMVQIASEPPPPPSSLRPEVDALLEGLCLKALAKRPEDRFPSAAEFAAALGDYLEGRLTPDLTLPQVSPAQRAVLRILRELRGRGWERGLATIRGWLPAEEGLDEPARRRLLSWLIGEAEAADVEAVCPEVPQLSALAAWVPLRRVHECLHQFDMAAAWKEILRAEGLIRTPDPALEGELAYLRGYVQSRQGQWDEARRQLHLALEKLGVEHSLAGLVLNALGRTLAGKCHYHAACEAYRQAIRLLTCHNDEPGLLESYEDLGRTHIDWNYLDLAEDDLNAGLKVAQRRRDPIAEARLILHLGRVVLRRGEQAAAQGKKAAASKRFQQAADYFEWAVRAFDARAHPVAGRARVNWALLCLYSGNLLQAEEHLRRSEQAMVGGTHPLVRCELLRVQARLRHAQGRPDEALLLLRQALAVYDSMRRHLEAARTQLELARILATAEVPQRMVVRAYRDALSRAEEARSDELVAAIDGELESIDEEAYWRQVFERVRSSAAPLFPGTLHTGVSEVVTILCLEFADFESFCRGQEPEAVLRTMNQLLAEFEEVFHWRGGHVTGYLGSGLLALVREAGHAERAVHTALDLRAVVAEFNRPRGLLGLPRLPARIGVATGPVFLGNLGTYQYLCFTPVGPVVNLARHLAHQAVPESPCISQETQEQVRDHFVYRPDSPRQVEITAVGASRVWDVADRGRPSSKPSGRQS